MGNNWNETTMTKRKHIRRRGGKASKVAPPAKQFQLSRELVATLDDTFVENIHKIEVRYLSDIEPFHQFNRIVAAFLSSLIGLTILGLLTFASLKMAELSDTEWYKSIVREDLVSVLRAASNVSPFVIGICAAFYFLLKTK
jgi:hypothetical protein